MGKRCLLAATLALSVVGLLAAPAFAVRSVPIVPPIVPDPAGSPIIINTTVDQSLGDCSVTCSLRDAIALSDPGATLAVPAGHYVLTLGDITITQSLTLAGSGARTTVIDGNGATGGESGGIFNMVGGFSVEFDDLSLVNGVATAQGGAISAQGQIVSNPPLVTNPLALTIRRCTIANNQVPAGQGGGVALQIGTLDIEDSTFSGNSSTPLGGGGLLAINVTASIVNSTFSGNSSLFNAAGMILAEGTFSLTNNTITANTASGPGTGVRAVLATITLSNNVIALNTGGDCGFVANTEVSDHNLDSDNTCGLTGTGDLPGVNPLLGPLENNGGPTNTQALLAGSPAINAGNNATCPATDQRGIARPQGPACDIGAYEDTLVSITVNNASVTVNEGQTATNSGTVTDVDGGAVNLTASVGTVVNNGNGTWSWSFPATDPNQSQTVTITATAADGSALPNSVMFGLVVVDVPPSILSVTNNGPILPGGTATITVHAVDHTGDGDTLAYQFDCNNDGNFEIGPQAGNTATCTFTTVGPHTVNVRVTDGAGGVTLGSTTVLVNLDCTHATAFPDLLWPPDHLLVPILILGIQNPGGNPLVFIQVTSIFQDEPVGSGEENCAGDDRLWDSHAATSSLVGKDFDLRVDGFGVGLPIPFVRAERSCQGNGRVYHIAFTATNSQHFSCMGSVKVGVPRHFGVAPVDGGSLFDSTKP